MYTYGYLFYIPITLIYALIIISVGIFKKRSISYYLVSVIFGVYLNMSIDKVFFPLFVDGREHFTTVKNFVDLGLNFRMLNTYQIIGNILVTFPLGILLPFITNFKNITRTIIIMFISISFELIQLVLISTLKTMNIFFDSKDIILNVTGGLLGSIAFILISKLISKIPVKEKDYKDLFSYIYHVCQNTSQGKKSLDNI